MKKNTYQTRWHRSICTDIHEIKKSGKDRQLRSGMIRKLLARPRTEMLNDYVMFEGR